jgi:predicted CDP-diglyceride synthetase/phosphatidate cytidylyltransferase
MLINMWGISWVTRLSLIFLFFILSPFLAEFIALPIMGDLQWDTLDYVPAFSDIQWSLFISTTLWSFGTCFTSGRCVCCAVPCRAGARARAEH